MSVAFDTMLFVGTVLESSFYGLYCVAFAVHARIRSKNKGGGTNIAIYPLSLLFILCTVFCAIDIAQSLFTLRFESEQNAQFGLVSYNMNIANTAMYCAITFIAQGVLIYRCWLMWGKQLLVISIPLILAWASFGTSLVMLRALIEPTPLRVPGAASAWYFPLGTAAFAVSFSVNAIVATLLAIKIYTLQQYAKQKHRSHPVRNMISIFNDSGMLMLACQIVWLALFHRNNVGFVLVRGPFVMIYGLTPTLIFQQISSSMSPTSSNSSGSSREKPKSDRSTRIRFAF